MTAMSGTALLAMREEPTQQSWGEVGIEFEAAGNCVEKILFLGVSDDVRTFIVRELFNVSIPVSVIFPRGSTNGTLGPFAPWP